MKEKPILLVFFIFLFVTACGSHFTSTSSDLYVVKKAHSKDYKKASIIAYDPNSITRKKEIKIMVLEPMVWNLIEVNKTYFTSYSKDQATPVYRIGESPSNEKIGC